MTTRPRTHGRLYSALNIAFVLYVILAATVGGYASPRIFYLIFLFALCSAPLLLARAINDRYAVCAIFMCIYFVFYGAQDVLALTGNANVSHSDSALTQSELLILVGGFCTLIGYRYAASRQRSGRVGGLASIDWQRGAVIGSGLLLWGLGMLATLYWNVRLTVRSGEFHAAGPVMTTVLMAGRYSLPLGLLFIAYAYAKYRARWLTALTLGIVALQIVLGFVSNTKSEAMLGGILVIVASTLVRGKVPKVWLLSSVAFVTVAFPIFQAYRAVVVYEQGMSNAEAAGNIGKALDTAINNVDRINGHAHGASEDRAQSFFERSSLKSAVEMIVTRTGVDVPYQYGHTLTPLVGVFVPRVLWPTKPDIATGVLVNTEFRVTDNNITYISPSHLGEMYWNFGWPGAMLGMLGLGLLLGWIGRSCDMSQSSSVTRLVILAVTIQQLCVRFEGTIAVEYAVWLRSIVGVLILHWITLRAGYGQAHSVRPPAVEKKLRRGAQLPIPNLLR